MRIKIPVYPFALLICALLQGCQDDRNSKLQIFRYNESSGIATLDPAFAKNQSVMWAVHQLYSTLVEVDQEMNIRPLVAKRWKFSDDKRIITFYLRDDVYFHDDPVFENGKGRKVIADDIAFSLNRVISSATASPGAWIFNNRVTSKPFIALDDTTFVLTLSEPFLPILGILSMQYCSIVAREAVERYGTAFRRHPVGTGPFRFTAWEEGQALILGKNENYFEKDSSGYRLPLLDGVKISFHDSKATEFLEFRQHRLDFINDIDASFKDEILTKTGNLRKEWQGKLALNKHAYLNIEYLGILSDTNAAVARNSPLVNKKVRKAINYAIDRKKMMLYLRNSIGTAANSGFVPAGLPSFNADIVKGYEYNPVKAKQLLKEAGMDKTFPVIKLSTVPNYANLATYIANDLKQCGINVQVDAMQKNLLLEQTAKSQAAFFRGSWIADYPDAENYLSVFYSKNPAPPNYTRFKNHTYDQLYEQALRETVDSIRYDLYQQMDRIIIEEAPVVPLWYDMVLHLVQVNIKNFYPNSLNMLELRKVKKF